MEWRCLSAEDEEHTRNNRFHLTLHLSEHHLESTTPNAAPEFDGQNLLVSVFGHRACGEDSFLSTRAFRCRVHYFLNHCVDIEARRLLSRRELFKRLQPLTHYRLSWDYVVELV